MRTIIADGSEMATKVKGLTMQVYDVEKTVREWMRVSHEVATEKGWWETERNFGEQIALMHSELSEALEEYRDNHPVDDIRWEPNKTGELKPEGIVVEFADVLIRIFDTCERYGMPLSEALAIKTAYNKLRPYRHGGKVA